jgi:tRNA/rRNA methyltransferase
MKNTGLSVLRIVGEAPGLEAPEARALAYGAWDVLDRAHHHRDLGGALATSGLVVGASGRPAPAALTPRELAARETAVSGARRVSIVFGPEASGLRNDELALCHEIVRIPTAPEQTSLNLAQAVLVIGYEIFLSSSRSASRRKGVAPAGDLEAALDDLRAGLLAIGYLNAANPEAILTEIRRLVARAAPTDREVALLRGLGRQMRWAGSRIAKGEGTDP